MDPELKQEIAEIHVLEKDNHQMLRAIRRDQWFGFIGRIIIWAIVLALPLYFYQQYIQPIITKIQGVSTTTSTTFSGFSLPSFPSSTQVQKLIDSYKKVP